MIKVRATDVYEKNGILDKELQIIPKKGHEFEVTDERYSILSGNNKRKLVFVEKIKKEKSEANQGSE